MPFTPVEIRHVRFPRAALGYRQVAVDALLDDVAQSFEAVWRERADLADKVEQLEADLVRYRELEALLRATLVSAERASADMKEQARKEADVIVAAAHEEARAVTHRAAAEVQRLRTQAHKIRLLLHGALDVIEDDGEAAEAA